MGGVVARNAPHAAVAMCGSAIGQLTSFHRLVDRLVAHAHNLVISIARCFNVPLFQTIV